MLLVMNKTTNTEEPTVAINVPLPVELHRQIRIAAIERGCSLKEAVIEAIRSWLA
jgi:hypothetical protein